MFVAKNLHEITKTLHRMTLIRLPLAISLATFSDGGLATGLLFHMVDGGGSPLCVVSFRVDVLPPIP